MTRLGKIAVVVVLVGVWLVSMGGWFVLGRVAFLNATEPSPITCAP